MKKRLQQEFQSLLKMKMENLMLFLVLTLLGLSSSAHSKYLDGCERVSSLNSDDISLHCHLRTINSEFDKTNFSAILGGSLVSLRLSCSEVLFYQSTLEARSFSHLSRLNSLYIDHCKLSRLPDNLFAGIDHLKNLTIRTYNTAWPALSLDIALGVFNNLQQLESVDISSNNIWTFPERLFCPLKSIINFNASHNRLQDLNDLFFRQQPQDHKESLIKGISNKGCKLPLKVLDISNNRLIVLPPGSLSSLFELTELYLESNEISIVADKALQNLKNLKILNLSGNKVVALPEDIFNEDTPEITEIHLQNNSLSNLAPRIFEKLSQLVVLDLSYNSLSHFNNTNGLIRLVLLNLGYNRLSKLEPSSFQDLYSLQILNLENNQIQFIDGNTFSSMNNLHTLILSNNKISFIDSTALNGLYVLSLLSLDNNQLTGLHPSALHNCSSLKDLNLNGNNLLAIPEAIQNLTLLKTIDLGENKIEELGLKSRLTGLPNLYGLRLTGNKIQNVSKDAFSELFALKVLNLARNSIDYVQPGSFDLNRNLQAVRLDSNFLTNIEGLFSPNLYNLIWLNISDNHLSYFNYSSIPPQLQWLDIHKNFIEELINNQHQGLKLQTLDASFNKLTRISSDILPDSLEMVFLNDNLITTIDPHSFFMKTNLSRVDIFANQIETLELTSLQLHPFPEDKSLPEFYIGGNPIECTCKLEWLQRINKLEHLRQHPKVMDLDSVHCKLVYNRQKYYVPLLEANPSQFLCEYNTHCFALCHCCEFSACDCQQKCPDACTCYHDDTWSANIVDCSNANHFEIPGRIPMDSTEIYLDGNHFEELASHVFIGRKNLHVLYINGSGITRIANNSFSGLKRLGVLNLANNYVDQIFGFEFHPLESLRELYLQNNQIRSIGENAFSNLRMLEVLRLDGNKLKNFAFWTLSMNPYLVEISLKANPWSCSCEFLSQAVPWLESNRAKLIDAKGINCRKSGKVIPLAYMKINGSSSNINGRICSELKALSDSIESYDNEVSESTALPQSYLILATVMGIFLALGSILVILCRKRRNWASMGKGSFCHCYNSTTLSEDDNSINGGQREKIFDLYIAYSVKDEPWVAILNNELYQYNYKICLHYKDFPVNNSYLADNIVEAVDNSKRTIIILSKSFLQNEWSRFEFKSGFHAALRGSKKNSKIIAINLGDLNTPRDFDPDLRVCLRSATILNASDKFFWNKLKNVLPEKSSSSSSSITSRLDLNGTNLLTPVYVPQYPPPNRAPPPFPAPRRPPPPTPLWP